jgi:UDP-glucose 4-epimerase
MRIVVTGGAGYIGSVVTEAIVEQGHEALVVDNLSKGHRDAVPEHVAFAGIDLKDTSAVAEALRSFATDAVIHLAASSLVGESMTDPAKYYDNNMVAGLSLLAAMRAANVGHLVFSSTAAVYGEPEQQPITEDAPTVPTNTYGETKLAFERALGWYFRAHGLSSVSLRYFNAAGASARNGEQHDPETHLIPLVLDAAAGEREAVTVFGNDYPTRDGTCVRDYIHVLDLADAHLLALHALRRDAGCFAFNLGCGGDGYTVREVIDSVEHVTGHRVPVRIAERRPGDPAVLIASSNRIRDAVGWAPRFQQIDTIVESAWRWRSRQSGRSVSADPLERGKDAFAPAVPAMSSSAPIEE